MNPLTIDQQTITAICIVCTVDTERGKALNLYRSVNRRAHKSRAYADFSCTPQHSVEIHLVLMVDRTSFHWQTSRTCRVVWRGLKSLEKLHVSVPFVACSIDVSCRAGASLNWPYSVRCHSVDCMQVDSTYCARRHSRRSFLTNGNRCGVMLLLL